MIDDATGTRHALLASEETTHDALKLLWAWVERYGVPESLYVDRKSVYWTDRQPSLEEQLAGVEPATGFQAFGQVCQRLGIEIIPAYSAQAKGRIERSHGVYQDRLVKLITLDGLTEKDQVNAVLEDFDQKLNRRFTVEPASELDAHVQIAPELDLADVFVLEHTRTVQNDWTVRFENAWYQISGPKSSLPPAKDKVQVLKRLDGSLAIHYRGRAVEYELLPSRPEKVRPRPAPRKPSAEPWRPAPDHPWRQSFVEETTSSLQLP